MRTTGTVLPVQNISHKEEAKPAKKNLRFAFFAPLRDQFPMLRIVKYVLYDILQNRIVIGYTLFLLAVSFGLFNLGDDPTKGVVRCV